MGYPDEVILGGFGIKEKLSIFDATNFLQARQNTNDPDISYK